MDLESATQEDRRSGNRSIQHGLVTERTEMLALFCRVAGLEPYEEQADKEAAAQVMQQFCQVLVDYIAAGHFGLYERIVNGTERRQNVAALAEQLYPRIAKTTEVALDFNDKYDCENHCKIDENLSKDLSMLGEELAVRVDLEDQLLRALAR